MEFSASPLRRFGEGGAALTAADEEPLPPTCDPALLDPLSAVEELDAGTVEAEEDCPTFDKAKPALE